ncbi:hypothetical protein GF380_04830 [Candidatus Uhrbacteria bacterium]|nr:hypothetical protein [Candidatus Uhrbacteria bacterium]MBD3284371.1 hypothetical protein [Candidatus Uhrbacteria bacterium]
MKRSLFTLLVPLLGLVLLGQGCFGGGSSSGSTGPDGGVFKTSDYGETWAQKRVLLKGPKAVSLGNDVITWLIADPQDPQTVYAGTGERGLIFSLDGGDSWQEAANAPQGQIESVAVDPKDKCTVYITIKNKIYKTDNCNRDWEEIFFDPKTDKTFTRIAVDWFNPTIIYAGTSEGDIFKSTDAGLSWLVSKRANASITWIELDPQDSRVVYVSAYGDGLWKTMDAGNTWIRIRNEFRDFRNARRIQQVHVDDLNPDQVYITSKYGILKSPNAGERWEEVKLTSEPNAIDIHGFAMNPRNSEELFYVTDNTLMTSMDGGETWNAQRLPSNRNATSLLLDAEDGKTLYIGFGPTPK